MKNLKEIIVAIIFIIINGVVTYLTTLIPKFKMCAETALKLFIVISILILIGLIITLYVKKINRELVSIKQILNNHGGFISYFLSEYVKKKDSKFKYPSDYDEALIGLMGYLSTANKKALERFKKEQKEKNK
jgi:hypothetical protein